MKARAVWHFGHGPDYCRSCQATGRDCGTSCPYAQHAPETAEGAAAWMAATSCLVGDMAGARVDVPAALAAAAAAGAAGWPAVQLVLAVSAGLAEADATRRKEAETA